MYNILDSMYKCYYNVFYASVTMCQQLLTVNLDKKLNSSKCDLSLDAQNYDCTLKHSRITSIVCVVACKGSFGVSKCLLAA